jgi:hypothetical protein
VAAGPEEWIGRRTTYLFRTFFAMTDQTNSEDKTIPSLPDNAAQAQKSSDCKATPSAAGSDIWECTQCGLYGPWEGVICENCGTRAKPEK